MKLIAAVFLFLPFLAKAQSINGTVTYAFSENAAGKADPGSKVYIFKYESDGIAAYDTLVKFLAAKNYRTQNSNVGRYAAQLKDSADVVKGKRKYEAEYAGYQARIATLKTDADARSARLQEMGAGTKTGFDSLDYRAAKAVSKIKFLLGSQQTVADAGGAYSLKTTPGKYGVLIMSNSRTGFSSAELYGKIFVQQVELKEAETLQVNAKFTAD